MQKGEATTEAPTIRLALAEHRKREHASGFAPTHSFAPGNPFGLGCANNLRPKRTRFLAQLTAPS